MKLVGTIKKHRKAIAIGAGIAVLLYVVQKKSTPAPPAELPIGPTRDQLATNTRDHRGLGSL